METINFNRFRLLSDDQLAMIDQSSRALLWEVGVKVDADDALDYYENFGCAVNRETHMVRIPNSVITKTLSMCASTVRLYDRRHDEPMVVGGNNVHFGTVGIATNVLDFETNEYRGVLTKDLIDFISLADALPNVDYLQAPATPTEVPADVVDLIETRELLLHTSKHFIAEAANGRNVRKTIAMAAEVAGGLEKLRERPFLTMQICLTSPLHFRRDCSELAIEWGKYGLPFFIESGPMSGGTGPATLAQNLILANAELLNAFVMIKAVNPDTPVMYFSWARILDMKRATCSHGGPEFGMQRICTTQMAKYYGLPSGGGATLADTKCIDAQLGMEKMGSALLPALAGNNMCSGMGLFADENAISMETLVIDNEIVGWINRVLRGVRVDKETTDLAVFKEVGPGGDFVRCRHTRENYLKEQFIPEIMDRGYLAIDKDPLKNPMRKRVRKYYEKVMKDYKAPEVSSEVAAKLDEIINSEEV